MLSPTSWKTHGVSHQFPIASVLDTLELKAKYIKKEEGMNVISSKKKNTNNNQLQKLQLLPKKFNEKRSNRGIWQESVRGLQF